MGKKRFGAAGLVWLLLAGGSAVAQSGTPLADAAEKMDRAKVGALLKQGTDVNAVQADGMTALHWAVYHDDLRTTTLLLNAGANAKAANHYAVTPLAVACTNGNTEIVELLLKAGADPKATLRGGETALMTAARTGKPGPVKALLARGADVNAKDRKGQTALMWAAADGHADAVAALLAAGADFRTPLPSGFTPLLFAAREGRIDVVRILLKAGADVHEATQPQKVPSRGPRAGTSALLLAVENGHFELAIALVKAGADPNDQRSGCAALHMISWVRKPNRGDSEDGDPPPIGSGKLTSLEFVKQMAALGADVNLPQKKGVPGRGILSRVGATPLIAAASTSDVALLRTYIELGADPKLANADGTTPLLAAAGVGVGAPEEAAGSEPEALEAVELLLKLGADVNAVDKNGENAMHGAAYRNHPKIVQLLADKGAKIEVWNRPNKHGLTPLVIAEGHRPGLNFRPSPPTVAAFHRVMRAAGVTPPKSSPLPVNLLKSEYGDGGDGGPPDGWRSLPLIKDGKVDPGWVQLGWGGFVVEDGSLRTECDEKGLGLLLYRKEKFGNCQIRVVYKAKDPKSNAGVFVRIDDGILAQVNEKHPPGRRGQDGKLTKESLKTFMEASAQARGPWYAVHHGYEVQICDAEDAYHRTGAVYSLAKAAASGDPPATGWRTMVITLKGNLVLVDIDGKRITAFDPDGQDVPKDRKWYEPRREPKRPQVGYLGLQNHDPGDVVYFKEVSVRPLKGAP